MGTPYRECQNCGAHLDAGELCDCRRSEREPRRPEQEPRKPMRLNLFIYLLVTKDVENAAYRVEQLKKLKGVSIYAQPERNERKGIIPNDLQKEFAQRYVYGRSYLKESWPEYLERHKEKRLHT